MLARDEENRVGDNFPYVIFNDDLKEILKKEPRDNFPGRERRDLETSTDRRLQMGGGMSRCPSKIIAIRGYVSRGLHFF